MSTIEPTADTVETGEARQSAVVFDNVSIVFGDKPELALPLRKHAIATTSRAHVSIVVAC